jgi:hypothetical protein
LPVRFVVQTVWSTGTLFGGAHSLRIGFTDAEKKRAHGDAISRDAVEVDEALK